MSPARYAARSLALAALSTDPRHRPAGGEFHYFDDLYLAYGVQGVVACLGAGGAGGSTQGKKNAAGGAGAGELGWELNLDLTPGGLHQYSIGKAGQPVSTPGSGQNGGDSWFQGSTVQVRGHGGQGAVNAFGDYSQGNGGLGGTGSVNTFHQPGGAGQQGYYLNWEGGGSPAGLGAGGQFPDQPVMGMRVAEDPPGPVGVEHHGQRPDRPGRPAGR